MLRAVTVTVKLFAAYQEAYGQPEVVLELPEGTTMGEVCDRICAPYPELKTLKPITRYGINLAFVEADTPIQNGDEVVLIPPVSGG
ncbi:MAG: MoaD/ThiS family protein [Thermosynechococcaceae cyanobacterium]